MADIYNIFRINTSAEYAMPSLVFSGKTTDHTLDEVKSMCAKILQKATRQYNEHVRVELWLRKSAEQSMETGDKPIHVIEK